MKRIQGLTVLMVILALGLWGCGSKTEEKKQKTEKKTEKVEKKSKQEGVEPAEAAQTEPAVEPEATNEGAEEQTPKVAENTPEDTAKPADEDPAGDEPQSTIVATVNGVEIDAADHISRLRKRFRGKVTAAMLRKTIVDRMINDELLKQEIAKVNVVVSDEELADAMKMEPEAYRAKKDDLETKAAVYRKRIAERKVLETRGLLSQPTEEELKKQYQREFSVHLQTISIPLRSEMSAEDKARSEALAQEVLAEVKKGTTFQEAVKERTDLNGRRLIVKPLLIKKGDRRHGDLWAQADKLEEKGFGGPVETPRGYIIYQVVRKRVPKQGFEDMKERLTNRVLNMKVGQARHRLIKDLRDGADIKYLINFENDPTLKEGMGKRPGAGIGRLGKRPRMPKALREMPGKPSFRGKAPSRTAAPAPEKAPAAE